jgi:hypothetical protein
MNRTNLRLSYWYARDTASAKLRRLLWLSRRFPTGRLLFFQPTRRRIRARLGLDLPVTTGRAGAGVTAGEGLHPITPGALTGSASFQGSARP